MCEPCGRPGAYSNDQCSVTVPPFGCTITGALGIAAASRSTSARVNAVCLIITVGRFPAVPLSRTTMMWFCGSLMPSSLNAALRGHDVAGGAVRPVREVELAELGHHDAVVAEVLQALLDHLDRVEVALREHERPR